ncbi:palmitoyl-CoA hydrolase [Malassezia yamatoensis]|uniref:Palmitoyl-CoA hydrolase n=1 Tax=Malassezia yamatoensis TaxID=253288 RepID=A0AAJ6CF59_9BASI|nr:palmitoyl-CoA hydrolase [Malassezia yamatoensis]
MPVAGRAVFGGLLIAQAMDAANKSVPEGFQQHGKFLNPGLLQKFRFDVSRLRDGRSYLTRRVDVWQEGILVFTASMSFQRPEPEQPDYYAPPPIISATGKFELLRDVPDGHSNVPTHVLPPELSISGENRFDWALENAPKDVKWYPLFEQTKAVQAWLPVEYRHFLINAMQANINLGPASMMTSLDHTMWFSNTFRMSDWLLMVIENQSTSNGRALVMARVYNSSGLLVATTNEYLGKNKPVILPFDLVQNWPAFTDLVDQDRVDWSALVTRYGDHQVPVVTDKGEDTCQREMSLAEAVDMIQDTNGEKSIYIKDWHLTRCARTDKLAKKANDPLSRILPYRTPHIFSDDWMNNVNPPAAPTQDLPFAADSWLLTHQKAAVESDDFRFCYAGFPDQRSSELASSYSDMEDKYAADRLGPYRDGYDGWPGWQDVRARVYTLEQETDDAANALRDVRDMLYESNRDSWQMEFTQLVQDIVLKNAGWAWEGFWRMILHNLEQPPCKPSHRSPSTFVYGNINSILTRFSKREDAQYLPSEVHQVLSQLRTKVESISS